MRTYPKVSYPRELEPAKTWRHRLLDTMGWNSQLYTDFDLQQVIDVLVDDPVISNIDGYSLRPEVHSVDVWGTSRTACAFHEDRLIYLNSMLLECNSSAEIIAVLLHEYRHLHKFNEHLRGEHLNKRNTRVNLMQTSFPLGLGLVVNCPHFCKEQRRLHRKNQRPTLPLPTV